MSDTTTRTELRAATAAQDPAAEAAALAATDREETPAMRRARLRAERDAAAAAVASLARVALLESAVELELDLRAGGPGVGPSSPEHVAATARATALRAEAEGLPYGAERGDAARTASAAEAAAKALAPRGRLALAMAVVGELAAASPGLAAISARLCSAASCRTAAGAVPEGPCAVDRRGCGGRWLRQGGAFLRSRDDLAVGAYAYGENGKPRSTERGVILARREVGDAVRYLDVATGAEGAVPAAIEAVAAAQAEVDALADVRERAEAGA